ncbi:MAG: SynChlorMet cassette protein ScmD [Candidatus Aminicenantes bacterium]|nr:SynChlorMet cassette protein ScmD [Candidatus Aminicenantes bacterium]
MTLPNQPTVNPNIVLREEFDDWAVLFDPDTANAVGVNPVGVAIWKRLDGKHTLDEIAKEVRDTFSEPTDKVEEDVAAFVQQLIDAGMIGKEVA